MKEGENHRTSSSRKKTSARHPRERKPLHVILAKAGILDKRDIEDSRLRGIDEERKSYAGMT